MGILKLLYIEAGVRKYRTTGQLVSKNVLSFLETPLARKKNNFKKGNKM